MKKSIFAIAAIVAIVLSGMAVCCAQLPPPPAPPGPVDGTTPVPESTTSPQAGGLTPITKSDVISKGGEPPTPMVAAPGGDYALVISGIQIWSLDPVTGQWTFNPISLNLYDKTWILLYTDQYQTIATEETYPTGWVDRRNWGWHSMGYYYYVFTADTLGRHRIVAVGGNTGRSNELIIDVSSGGGGGPFTVTAWPSSSSYTIGSPSTIYFTVNKPCQVRVTYLKQGSNVVWSGPRYVSAGTHTDTGTIGSPRGVRTVVVDAWTSSGEYAYAVTTYTVY
jgi:hypothetical protein